MAFGNVRSCESQLIITINELIANMDATKQTDAILLDFSKAFDKVPKERLLLKLKACGVNGRTHDWIRDFLSDHSQHVAVEGAVSDETPVLSGVPQGSVLGPLLFLVYINDLPSCISSTARLFADDTLLYRQITCEEDTKALQEDLDALEEWETKWQMEFNPIKCETLHITNKRNHIKTTYTIHSHPLKTSTTSKYLGLTLTPKMKFNTHINLATKKANSICTFLKRNIRSCPIKVKEKAYMSLVRPITEYAAIVWDPFTKENIQKLEQVQRRAARFVLSDYGQNSSVTAMLEKLGWESLQQRRARAKATYMYRIVNNLVDIPGHQYLKPSPRQELKFIQIQPRIDAYKYSFFPSTIEIWNKLPQVVKLLPEIDTFKNRINQTSCIAM